MLLFYLADDDLFIFMLWSIWTVSSSPQCTQSSIPFEACSYWSCTLWCSDYLLAFILGMWHWSCVKGYVWCYCQMTHSLRIMVLPWVERTFTDLSCSQTQVIHYWWWFSFKLSADSWVTSITVRSVGNNLSGSEMVCLSSNRGLVDDKDCNKLCLWIHEEVLVWAGGLWQRKSKLLSCGFLLMQN